MTLARGGRVSHSGFFCIFGQSLLFFFMKKEVMGQISLLLGQIHM